MPKLATYRAKKTPAPGAQEGAASSAPTQATILHVDMDAFLGSGSDKGQRVGVEFLTPAPHFWGVEFPPPDWPAKSASTNAD